MKKIYHSTLRRTHIEMIRSVVNYALAPANVGVTQSVPALFDVIMSLQSSVQQIDFFKAQAGSPITGITAQKELLRTALTNTSISIMSSAFTYAVSTNNEVLASQMKNSPSYFNRMSFEAFVLSIQQAVANATPFVSSLEPYGVTPAMFGIWQTQLTDLTNALTSVRNAITNRKALHQQIQTWVSNCMNLLYNQSDPLVNSIKETQPAYWLGYHNNRKLVNTGHISTQLRATVVDELNQPIFNALVYIDGTDRKAATATDGYCLINDIPFGQHTVTVVTGTNTRIFGPFDFKKGQSLTKQFVTVPAFAAAPSVTPAPVTVSVN